MEWRVAWNLKWRDGVGGVHVRVGCRKLRVDRSKLASALKGGVEIVVKRRVGESGLKGGVESLVESGVESRGESGRDSRVESSMGNGMTRDWKVEWQVELRQLNGKWSRVGQVLGGVVRVS